MSATTTYTCDYCGGVIPHAPLRSHRYQMSDGKYAGGYIRVTIENLNEHCKSGDMCESCALAYLKRMVGE